jgi:hypothetical protein
MSVTSAEKWIAICNGIPQREMPTDAICANGRAFLTEDEDYWYLNFFNTDEPVEKMAKIPSNSQYPFALVAKWGFSVVNAKRYEELEREDCISQGLDYDTVKAELAELEKYDGEYPDES